jgi:hypothetical protein
VKAYRVVRRRGSYIFLDSRFTDGVKVVSPLPPRKITGTHFCYCLSRSQGHNSAGRIRSIEKIHLIGTRTHDLPACSIVPQPTTLPHTPHKVVFVKFLLQDLASFIEEENSVNTYFVEQK